MNADIHFSGAALIQGRIHVILFNWLVFLPFHNYFQFLLKI